MICNVIAAKGVILLKMTKHSQTDFGEIFEVTELASHKCTKIKGGIVIF